MMFVCRGRNIVRKNADLFFLWIMADETWRHLVLRCMQRLGRVLMRHCWRICFETGCGNAVSLFVCQETESV